jgi:hypothetical protein
VSDGCRDVDVVDGEEVSRRSMVYTEYFVKGTEPTEYCDLHQTHGVFEKIARFFGSGEKPPPPRIDPPPPPAAPVPVAAGGASHVDTETPETPTTTATRKTEKRGFWGRLFRRDAEDKDHEPLRPSHPGR